MCSRNIDLSREGRLKRHIENSTSIRSYARRESSPVQGRHLSLLIRLFNSLGVRPLFRRMRCMCAYSLVCGNVALSVLTRAGNRVPTQAVKWLWTMHP
jgi:hypothetical protein